MSEKNNNIYSVYVHVFPNGKKYFGITSKEPDKRWRDGGSGYLNGSQVKMKNAILKYGWINVTHIVLLSGVSKEEAIATEINLISNNKSNDPNYGYNQTNGGEGTNRWTAEMRAKISKSKKGKAGHLHTEETKKKIALANSKRVFTKEILINMSNATKRQFKSKDARDRLSRSQPLSRTVIQIDPCSGVEIARFHSAKEAARSIMKWDDSRTGCPMNHIGETCKFNANNPKRRRTSIGFVWEFA